VFTVLGLAVAAALWILGCFLCLSVAESRGLGQVKWFLTAVFCSPLLALIALAATPAKR